jgi:predicted small lipoprotein YifL
LRKIAAVSMALALSLALAGCGAQPSATTAPSAETPQKTEEEQLSEDKRAIAAYLYGGSMDTVVNIGHEIHDADQALADHDSQRLGEIRDSIHEETESLLDAGEEAPPEASAAHYHLSMAAASYEKAAGYLYLASITSSTSQEADYIQMASDAMNEGADHTNSATSEIQKLKREYDIA